MSSLSRTVAIAASAVIHLGVAGLALAPAPRAHVRASAEAVVEIESAVVDAPAPTEPETPIAPPRHAHPYPAPAGHDARPHDSSLRHPHDPPAASTTPSGSEVSPSPVSAGGDPTLPRFTMTFGPRAATVETTAPSSAAGAVGAAGAAAVEAPILASEASVPARLVASVPPVYPAGARSDDIEGTVSLEIVLDTDGVVIDARVLRAAGHGFDESALAAVRRYRFTSAQRQGRAVRVRMPWTVDFRLR